MSGFISSGNEKSAKVCEERSGMIRTVLSFGRSPGERQPGPEPKMEGVRRAEGSLFYLLQG